MGSAKPVLLPKRVKIPGANFHAGKWLRGIILKDVPQIPQLATPA
jgi:hypothetical protein